MKKQRKWLYEKWLEEHSQEVEQEKISQKTGVAKEKITIKKVSFAGKVLEIITIGFYRMIAAIFFLVIFALISFGLTVLANPQLRTYVFDALLRGVK